MRLFFWLCCALYTDFLRCERQMDVSDWYTGMMSRGAFDRQLTAEQIAAKKRIEIMLKESSGADTPKRVSAKTLETYKALFKATDLKDETEMEEEEEDEEEEETEKYGDNKYSSSNEQIEENAEDRESSEQGKVDKKTNELPVNSNLNATTALKSEVSENVTRSKEIKYQSRKTLDSLKHSLNKCHFNNISSYLDVFYSYDSHIENVNGVSRFRTESDKTLTFKKLKKKKSRNKDVGVCKMKTDYCLRYWLSFQFKMCFPHFNWLCVNVTHNGVEKEECLPFPEKKYFGRKQKQIEESIKIVDAAESTSENKSNDEKSVDSKYYSSSDEYEQEEENAEEEEDSDEQKNVGQSIGEDEQKESSGIEVPRIDKEDDEINSIDQKVEETKSDHDNEKDGNKDDVKVDLKDRLQIERLTWLQSTERAIEKLLKLKESRSEDDLSVDKVTKIIDEKSREQLIKIQTLELSISKLENRLLREQLSKTNDSSSITRLENQILRLENELVKINQTYLDLRQENEQLKKSQRRYLELGHGPIKNDNQVLPESGSENYTLVIEQHKTKLIELAYLLRNQSELVSKYKLQLEQVENQNRILYQIVMNQSLLISQVMKKIQVLTDQIQECRQKKQDNMGLMTPTELIRHLENMVAKNRKSRRTKRVSKPQNNSPARQSSRYHHYETCLSKTCLKSGVTFEQKVNILFENRQQQGKGGLPESAAVRMSGYKEKSQNENTLKIETKRDDRELKSETKSKNIPVPPKKSETMRENKLSSQNNPNDEEELRKESKTITDKLRTNEPKDTDSFSKGKVPSDSKILKGPEMVKSTEKDATRRKKPLYEDPDNKEAKDCYEYLQKGDTRNGAYKIRPAGLQKSIEVFCDMKNGGWTIIQRRKGGTTDFFRDWNMYKKGFGGIYGEHWLGNDIIHHLTNQKECKLRIDLTDWDKNKVTAFYDYFMVDHESEGYRLHVEGFSGEGGDSLSKHNLNKFSTKDVDNDRVSKQFGGSCANRFSGAWWYHKCYSSNLNGIFYHNGVVAPKKFDGIAWKSWKGPNYSMMKTEMKIAPATSTTK